jgi:hypothetical protein
MSTRRFQPPAAGAQDYSPDLGVGNGLRPTPVGHGANAVRGQGTW